MDEVNYNDLMMENHKKTCKYLSYVERLFTLASTITDWVLVCVSVGIKSSAVGLKICAITARIINYKSIIKKNK